jgi:hypothetical protein
MRLYWSVLLLTLSALAARAQVLSPQEISAARKLYIAKCAKCHKLYDPAGYGDADWNRWMTKMAKKAHLNADQAKLLARYLDTVRAPQASAEKKPR